MATSIGVSIRWDRTADLLELDVPVSFGFAQGNGAAG
jgi:hypothetical protein